MSLYRPLLAALAAIVIASPVFADNNSNQMSNQNQNAPAATTDSSSDTMAAQVNINTASVKALMKVKGINASKARAIVAYRKKHGNFKSTDDLAKVKGFTKMKADDLKAIQDQLTM